MKLVFTKAAQRDLDNIALHIAKDNVDAALRVVVDIETRARLLLVTPSMGRRAAREGVRELVVDAQRLAAVVTYRERASAEVACAALNGCLTVRGSRCRVMWARKRGGGSGGGGGGAEAGAMRVHDHYGEGAVSGGGGPPPPPPPPPTGIAVSYGSRGRGVANTPTMWL